MSEHTSTTGKTQCVADVPVKLLHDCLLDGIGVACCSALVPEFPLGCLGCQVRPPLLVFLHDGGGSQASWAGMTNDLLLEIGNGTLRDGQGWLVSSDWSMLSDG